MDPGCVIIPLLILLSLAMLIRRLRPITIDAVSYFITRGEFRARREGTSCAIYDCYVGCDYNCTPEGAQTLCFKATFLRGKLTAEFDARGRLLRWTDGKGTYDCRGARRRDLYHEVWLLESMLGTVQNIALTAEDESARTK